ANIGSIGTNPKQRGNHPVG
ncbi:hypothetical protein D046_7547B, partial [Vibrio parahaemolyticus V-223/04]